jgi:hypothetical protein
MVLPSTVIATLVGTSRFTFTNGGFVAQATINPINSAKTAVNPDTRINFFMIYSYIFTQIK